MLSGLKRLHPAAIIACLIPQAVAAMFVRDAVVTAISLFFAAILFLRYKGISKIKYLPLCAFAAAVAGLLNTFINHRGDTPFLYINDSALTLESFFYGVRFAAVILAALLWFSVFKKVFTSDDVIYVFGRFAPSAALVISAVLRYIPLFASRIRETSDAHIASGARDLSGIPGRVRLAGDNVATMVTWSCETAIESADSMRARGYGAAKRSRRRVIGFRKTDVFVIVAGTALAVSTFVLIALGAGDFVYFPALSLGDSPLNAWLYASVALLSFIPVAVEIREEFLWTRSE